MNFFSRKLVSNDLSHPPVKFSNNNITRCSHQNHLGVVLDSNLNFNTHIEQKIKKCNKMKSSMTKQAMIIFRTKWKKFNIELV